MKVRDVEYNRIRALNNEQRRTFFLVLKERYPNCPFLENNCRYIEWLHENRVNGLNTKKVEELIKVNVVVHSNV